jgi:hypothetical protein
MEQQGWESFDGPPTDEQIAENMTEGIVIPCLASMESENEQLGGDLIIIDEALNSNVIDCRMSVRHVLGVLESGTAVNWVVNEALPESLFHKNYGAVQELKDALLRWTKKPVISNQDSVLKAFNLLAKKWEENRIVIATTLKE